MSLFKIKCPKCGHDNDKSAKFCSHCGEKLETKASRTTCPSCGAELPPGAHFCPKCRAEITNLAPVERTGDAAKEMGKNRQWMRRPGDFAQRFDVREDLRGFFTKGVTVEQGTTALLIQGGAYKGALTPDYYDFKGTAISRFRGNFDARATVILVDSGEVVLSFSVPQDSLRARNDIKVSAAGHFTAHLTNPVAFLENYLKSEGHVSLEDIENRISNSLQAIIQSKIIKYSAEELYGNAQLVSDLEQAFKNDLNAILKSTGIEIINLTSLGFDEGRWREVREARERQAVDIAREQVDFESRMKQRNLENAEVIDAMDGKAAVAQKQRDIDNQIEDERIARRHAGEEGELRHRNKIDDISRDHKFANEDLEIDHNLRNSDKLFDAKQERERKEFEQDMYEMNALRGIQKQRRMDDLDVKERDLAINRADEQKHIENLSNASVEVLLTMVGGNDSAAKQIAELELQKRAVSLTPEQILALNAAKSPEVAKAFQAKYSAEEQKEFNLRMEAANRENNQNMKEIMNRAIDNMGDVAVAKARGPNNNPTIVTGGGFGGPVIVNPNDTSSKKKCPKCGAEISSDDVFCPGCGSKL